MHIAVAIMLLLTADEAGSPESENTIKVLQGLADSSNAVQSLSVTYVSGDMSSRNPNLPAGSHLRREIAASRPGNYMHWSFHPHDALTWDDDPLQQRLFINEASWYNVNPVKNIFVTGSIKPDEALPGSAPYEFLFFATGMWPLDRPAPAFNGVPVFLHELPPLGEKFQRLNDDVVNGIACIVIGRPGVDTIWVDKARPSVLIAREFMDGKTGMRVQRFELIDHEEIRSGIWFPRKIKNLLSIGEFADNVRESLIDVQSVRINEDESGRFSWSPGPGALNVTSVSAPVQVLPGGTEILDRYLKFASSSHRTPHWSRSPRLIAAFVTFLIAFLGGFVFSRKRQRRVGGSRLHLLHE